MKRITLLSLILGVLCLAGCKKDLVTNTIMAEAEEASNDSKTEMLNESLVVWQDGDEITIRSLSETTTTTTTKATFKYTSGKGNEALFETEPIGEKYSAGTEYIALFPHREGNDLGSGKDNLNVTINLATEQEYAGDNTFGSKACPMVAYGGFVQNDLSRILFHNLAGVVRIQLRDNTGSNKTLSSIEFLSIGDTPLPVAGKFSVNNYEGYDPYLTPVDGQTSNKVTITFNDNAPTLGNALSTFYLAVPAQKGDAQYGFQMTVNATDGSKMVKQFTVPVRRNALVKLPALNITSWENQGTATATIAGNGTADRPFLIYTTQDLIIVRNAFNKDRYLNGVDLSLGTSHFRIMTNKIVLNPTGDNKWPTDDATRGGIDFKGHMYNYANQSVSDLGIENNTDVPIFHSIGANSSVSGLIVRGTCTTEDGNMFSPLCLTNNGTIMNCRVSSSATYVMNYLGEKTVGMAGICVYNSKNATISGCGCGGTLVARRVAGICYQNEGKIMDSYAASPMKVYSGSNESLYAAGICYDNRNIIKSCYFAANASHEVVASWGGIAYLNSGTVMDCYIATSGVMNSRASVGGIVHTMTDGLLDHCWNDADVMNVLNGTEGLGGIVNTLNGTTAEVRNCMRYAPTGTFECESGPIGGVVAKMVNGYVYNCAFYGDMSLAEVSQKGAFVGNMLGGTIANCYGLQNTAFGLDTPPFYGSKTGGTVAHCYGHTAVTDEVAVYNASTITGLLNSWPSDASWPGIVDTYGNSPYRQWVQSDSNPPQLTTQENYLRNPTTSKRRR